MSSPKKYYDHAGITIYHGDCLEIMPQLDPVDLVLTDPPYGVGKKYLSFIDTKETLLDLIGGIFKIDSPKLITCGIGNVWLYPPADWILCWNKPNAMTRAAVANANIWEPILVYGCRGFGVDGVTASIKPQNYGHPCPKPLSLFVWLLSKLPNMDVILDPFMGSGTTLVAAKELGRKAIGIEIEEKYCEIAARRLAQEMLPFGSNQSLETDGQKDGHRSA